MYYKVISFYLLHPPGHEPETIPLSSSRTVEEILFLDANVEGGKGTAEGATGEASVSYAA